MPASDRNSSNRPHHPPRRRRRRRRGGAYVLVLGTAMLVTVIGMTALAAGRLRARAAAADADAADAQAYAQSAIEVGRAWIAADPNWRTARPSGSWTPTSRPVGDGSFTLDVTNPNSANLNNSPADPVVMTGTGYRNAARHRTRVSLDPRIVAYTSLKAAMASGADQTYSGTGNAAVSGGTIASNGAITATGTNFGSATVQAALTATLLSCTYTVAPQSLAGTRTFPDAATVFDPYVTEGTPVLVSALPVVNGLYTLERRLVSPAVGITSATNAKGVYVIDCQGSSVVIQNCRIVGTLVLLNPGASSVVQGSVVWSPAVPNYPSLLVRGGMKIGFGTAALAEAPGGGVAAYNFNPSATPYPYANAAGSDADTLDTYPSQLDGLVYVSGALTLTGSPTVQGVIVAGGAISFGAAPLTLRYDNTFAGNPPPGFYPPPAMKVSAGTWSQPRF